MVAAFHPIIVDAADRVLSFNERRDMYLAYLSEDRAERDQIQRELDAKQTETEAERRGSARGEAAGLAKGAQETAGRALDSGLPPETVATITQLPLEEVLHLA
ncbi:MAG: hypothetical protein LBV00_07645 [Propionibacteriaceae bacterium]|nr:hypothetical protein [Propionibacteriaceae bacterium]